VFTSVKTYSGTLEEETQSALREISFQLVLKEMQVLKSKIFQVHPGSNQSVS